MPEFIGRHIFRSVLVFVVAGSLSIPVCADEADDRTAAPGGPQLDHVMLTVRDFAAAQRSFESMGFTLGPGGRQPTGLQNRIIGFEGKTYLELVAVWDEAKAFPDVVEFLTTREGGFSLALRVDSAEFVAQNLRHRGFEVSDPSGEKPATEGESAAPRFFQYVIFTKPVLPNNLFFIEYNEDLRRKIVESLPPEERDFTVHANGAQELLAVWVGVDDLTEAAEEYSDLGLEVEPAAPVVSLGATGRCVRVGRGCILLLEAKDPTGDVARFLARRGQGIIGVTVAVEDLERAASFLADDDGRTPSPYAGKFGSSVRLPADRTYGLVIELSEKR